MKESSDSSTSDYKSLEKGNLKRHKKSGHDICDNICDKHFYLIFYPFENIE